MKDRYLDRDLEQLSAYIDLRLSPAEKMKVEARLETDPAFKKLFTELTYTRRLLRALPQKRAPRNFTLSAEFATSPRRASWLQPALSFVSIAAAVLLVVVFASSYLLGDTRNAAPAAIPQAEELRAMDESAEATAPAIINWNPVFGMGGGGDDGYAGGIGGGGAGGPGWDITASDVEGELAPAEEPVGALPVEPLPEVTEEAPLTALAEPESGDPTLKTIEGEDLSTLILGLPEEERQGERINSPADQAKSERESRASLPVIPLMIISGIIAVLAGVAAILLRRS